MNLHRIPRIFAGLCIGLGIMFGMMGLRRDTIACTRASGECVLTVGPPLLEKRAKVEIAEIRGWEFVTVPGTFGPWGATVLIDRQDHEARIGSDHEAEARRKFAAIVAFLRGEGDAIEFTSPPQLEFLLIALALFLVVPLPYWIYNRIRARSVRASVVRTLRRARGSETSDDSEDATLGRDEGSNKS